MTYLHHEHIQSVLTNNTLYEEYIDCKKWFMYELENAKPTRAIESLHDSVAAALVIIKQEPTNRAVLQLEEQGCVVESRTLPETPLCSLTIRKDENFREGSFRFRDSGSSNISAIRARVSIWMMLPQPNNLLHLLTNHARVPVLTATERVEGLLEITYAAVSMDIGKGRNKLWRG